MDHHCPHCQQEQLKALPSSQKGRLISLSFQNGPFFAMCGACGHKFITEKEIWEDLPKAQFGDPGEGLREKFNHIALDQMSGVQSAVVLIAFFIGFWLSYSVPTIHKSKTLSLIVVLTITTFGWVWGWRLSNRKKDKDS